MARNNNLVRINREVLKQALRTRGLTMSGVSRELGHSDGYLKEAIKSGKLRTSVIKMLEALYQIPGSEILSPPDEPGPETEVRTETPAAVLELDYDRIYDMIVRAIREARECDV